MKNILYLDPELQAKKDIAKNQGRLQGRLLPEEILSILHSIEDIRLNAGVFEIKFKENFTANTGGWEGNYGYNPGSFTEQLLFLIEDALNGECE